MDQLVSMFLHMTLPLSQPSDTGPQKGLPQYVDSLDSCYDHLEIFAVSAWNNEWCLRRMTKTQVVSHLYSLFQPCEDDNRGS